MPRRPQRPCSFPGCPNRCDGQYCEEHAKQMNHRYNAVKKYGYVVLDLRHPDSDPSDRWLIYYDNDTRRSTRFERNLLRDGFKVLPWEE